MRQSTVLTRLTTLGAIVVLLLTGSNQSHLSAQSSDDKQGAVYAMTNEATGNRVQIFRRSSDGTLQAREAVATGGLGSGQFEDSSNGLILVSLARDASPNNLADDGRFLIATNAASNSVSVFRVNGRQNDRGDDNDDDDSEERSGRANRRGLTLIDVEPSNGEHPVSVSLSDGVMYVLNSGDAAFAPPPNCAAGPGIPNITGFTLSRRGNLTPIPGSTRPLSGDRNSGCAQVSFTPNGDVLVVTERTATGNRGIIATYTVNDDGTVNGPIPNTPTGIGPFGFNFTKSGFLLTTENFGGAAAPGQGHAAPYAVRSNGTLVATGPTVGNDGTDTCWLVLSFGDRYAYVTNFFSSSISSYRVGPRGQLTLLDPLADAAIGIGASDMATDDAGRYLYARNALEGTLDVFRIQGNGSLSRIQRFTGLPPNGIGLAAN